MVIQTLMTNQQACDWAFVVGRNKVVASGGKLLVNLGKQVALFIYFLWKLVLQSHLFTAAHRLFNQNTLCNVSSL